MPVQQPRPLPRPVPTSSSSVVPLPIQGAPVVSKSTSSSLNLLQKMIEKSKVASTKIPEIGLKINDLRK
jgi:C4-type Zn-finger protein